MFDVRIGLGLNRLRQVAVVFNLPGAILYASTISRARFQVENIVMITNVCSKVLYQCEHNDFSKTTTVSDIFFIEMRSVI